MTSFQVNTFPHQLPDPLERLNVYDGLIMNAERWEVSQSYLRHRQNVHFQAANQSGIVCGLGVKAIAPPSWSRARTRAQDAQRKEQRWLEIQPGIAIDGVGNPIVVGCGDERDRAFRIATPAPTAGEITVYIVARYVEPAIAAANGQPDTMLERCRFEEKTDRPDALDVELCRVRLTPGGVRLHPPRDVFSPTVGELDLRYRQLVRPRPVAKLRLGILGQLPRQVYENFEYLHQAMEVLIPDMQVDLAIADMGTRAAALSVDRFDALYVAAREFQTIVANHMRWFEAFVQRGGTVLLETDATETPIFSPQVQQLFKALVPWPDLQKTHPLKTHPFLFTQRPQIGEQRIELAIAEGLMWIGGGLSSAWGMQRTLPRSDIRTAHELGCNLLRYIWQRQHLTELMRWQVTPQTRTDSGS